MNGCSFTLSSSILLATVLFSTQTFAMPHKTAHNEIFRAKLGCMSCHQGNSVPTDKPTTKALEQQNTSNHK